MLGLVLLATVADPSVALSDAYAFGVPDAGCAWANYRSAWKHPRVSGFDTAAWRYLATALDETQPPATRRQALIDLRENLGADWYRDRRMPPSVPARQPWD